MDGPGGRDFLLRFFDTLGVVLHFPDIRYLTDLILNPRWLTYGVYSVMYSEAARDARGRIGEGDLESILKGAKPLGTRSRALHYPRHRCKLIADAMVAFQVAYRLANSQDRLVIPALLEPQQPLHDFKTDGSLAFQFDFKGFLPRHVLPALIVDHHPDIAVVNGEQIVWQNGVLLRPGYGNDAEALIRADYHARNIEILVQGSDANAYLGVIRDGILRTLQTMPELPFEEKIRLRPDMRVTASELDMARDAPVWADYESVRTAHNEGFMRIPVGKHSYELAKVLRVMPLSPDIQPADVFISYARKDRAAVDRLAADIKAKGYTVWYDPDLRGEPRFRETIAMRIDAAKAVVAVWTEHSVGSDWVIYEASRGRDLKKLVCLRDPAVETKRIPGPFPACNILRLDNTDDLLNAVARLCKKGR